MIFLNAMGLLFGFLLGVGRFYVVTLWKLIKDIGDNLEKMSWKNG